mmetsp:Transcript_4216/g.16772  ORF Transcript_4216/g.16772 Transcript_4216/m.16772 type:complete len:747 (-) Transcript_4216:40-2280(-)
MRAARGDAASATAASAEMERRMAAAQRAAAEASMRLKVGTASRELVATRLRDAEAEAAARAAEQRAAAERTRDELAASEKKFADAEEKRASADASLARTREDASALRAELARAVDDRATALGRAEDAETKAARLAGKCARLTRRLYPDKDGFPEDPEIASDLDSDSDANSSEKPRQNASSDELLVLRATLQGHPVGHDLDVTASLRARLRTRDNKRLVIAVSENLRTELFGDAFPRVDEASNATAVQSEESEESARAPEGRLIVEYAHAGAYYGVEKEASKDASEDASTIDPGKTKNQKKTRGSLCVATVAIGGVDTNAPFAVSSLWLDASPAAADAAARHAETRVRDAERALANVKAKLIRTETFVAELEHELVPLRARCEAAERREKTLTESARASLAESKTRAREAERFESEARRAVDVADAARARARQAVDAARDEAERRVAEAVRDERMRLEQKAREVRLASAAERRKRASPVETASNASPKVGSTWGVPRTTPSAVAARSTKDFVAENKKVALDAPRRANKNASFDVSGFLDAGEVASPLDAGYKTRKKASAAAAAEAEAWAAARAAAAAEVAAEVTRARRAMRVSPAKPSSEGVAVFGAEEEAENTKTVAFRAEKKSPEPKPAPVPPSPADEGRRRAEARVREFQRRETERLERSRRDAGVEPRADRPPPLFTSSERRAAAVEASTAEKLREARAALADAEVDGVRLEEALRRAADADRFDEELASARRRAAKALLSEK